MEPEILSSQITVHSKRVPKCVVLLATAACAVTDRHTQLGIFSKTGILTNSRSLSEGGYLETTSNSLLGSRLLDGFSRSMATLIKSTHNGNTSGIHTMTPILSKSKAPKP